MRVRPESIPVSRMRLDPALSRRPILAKVLRRKLRTEESRVLCSPAPQEQRLFRMWLLQAVAPIRVLVAHFAFLIKTGSCELRYDSF
jgi:hypothetical protein